MKQIKYGMILLSLLILLFPIVSAYECENDEDCSDGFICNEGCCESTCNPSVEDLEEASDLSDERSDLKEERSDLKEERSDLREDLQYEKFMLAYYKYAIDHQGDWVCPGDTPWNWYWDWYYECVYIYPHGDQYYNNKINDTKEYIQSLKEQISDLNYEISCLTWQINDLTRQIRCLRFCECDEQEPMPEKDGNKVTISSPPLGLGYQGSTYGDSIPALYTYVNTDGKKVTQETFPEEGTYVGPVICTPPRIAGEPLDPNNYFTTPKGKRHAQWLANHAE